jgi:ferredoxin-fold anticodon binding domain-containing protein
LTNLTETVKSNFRFFNLNKLQAYTRQRIETSECDILISIGKNIDENIIVVPELVNRMLKFIDCKLTVSFTIIQDTQ